MNLVRWIEIVIVSLVIIVVATQIILPLRKNRPLFPIFRKSNKLEKELGKVQQEVEDKKLAQKVNKLKKEVKSK